MFVEMLDTTRPYKTVARRALYAYGGQGVGEDRGLGEDRRGEGRAGAGGEGRLGDSWKIQYLLPVV